MTRSGDSGLEALFILGGLGLLGWALFPSEPAGEHTEPPPEGLSEHERNVLALARMLASETEDAKARVVIGWITVNAAHTWRMSLYRLLTGKSGQFGPQKYFYADGKKEVRYASTAKRPTPETMRIARGLLDGTLTPPGPVRSSRPSAYVELGKASKKLGPDGKPLQPEYTPERILAKQQSYGGIVGRLNNWFLYAKGAQPITSVDDATAV